MTIAIIIVAKPKSSLIVTSSLRIIDPSKIADKGLNPKEIAAWVGVINCNALPQQYIKSTPPGRINIINANNSKWFILTKLWIGLPKVKDRKKLHKEPIKRT